jgi:hypothetical protein
MTKVVVFNGPGTFGVKGKVVKPGRHPVEDGDPLLDAASRYPDRLRVEEVEGPVAAEYFIDLSTIPKTGPLTAADLEPPVEPPPPPPPPVPPTDVQQVLAEKFQKGTLDEPSEAVETGNRQTVVVPEVVVAVEDEQGTAVAVEPTIGGLIKAKRGRPKKDG